MTNYADSRKILTTSTISLFHQPPFYRNVHSDHYSTLRLVRYFDYSLTNCRAKPVMLHHVSWYHHDIKLRDNGRHDK